MQRDLLRLGHILDAGEAIIDGVEGVSADQLRESTDLLEALLWRFTKLGEAVNQHSDELREKYPHVEWAGAMALRNRVVHGYFDIDVTIVHGAATKNVPKLVDDVHTIVRLEFPDVQG